MGKKRIIAKAGEGSDAAAEKKPQESSVGRKGMLRGNVYIHATYNNTIITVTDDRGNAIAWASAGGSGFSGTKKATPFAAARVAEIVIEKVRKTGIQDVSVYVKGIGSGRDSAIRAIANQGLNILLIKDLTPIPHNGPRARKPRRV